MPNDIHKIVEKDAKEINIAEKPIEKPEKPIKEILHEKLGPVIPDVGHVGDVPTIGIEVKF